MFTVVYGMFYIYFRSYVILLYRDLSSNNIQNISEDVFSPLKSLKYLYVLFFDMLLTICLTEGQCLTLGRTSQFIPHCGTGWEGGA